MECKVENCWIFFFWPKRLMVRGLKSNWQMGTRSTSWWLALIWFKIFINYGHYQIATQWNVKQKHIVGVVGVLDSWAAILRGLHCLEMWVKRTLNNFNTDKLKSCNNCIDYSKLGTRQLTRNHERKDWGVLVSKRLNINHHCALVVAEIANWILVPGSETARRKRIFPSCFHSTLSVQHLMLIESWRSIKKCDLDE